MLKFAAIDGIVFNHIDLARNAGAKIRQLLRILQLVIEVAEDAAKAARAAKPKASPAFRFFR